MQIFMAFNCVEKATRNNNVFCNCVKNHFLKSVLFAKDGGNANQLPFGGFNSYLNRLIT